MTLTPRIRDLLLNIDVKEHDVLCRQTTSKKQQLHFFITSPSYFQIVYVNNTIYFELLCENGSISTRICKRATLQTRQNISRLPHETHSWKLFLWQATPLQRRNMRPMRRLIFPRNTIIIPNLPPTPNTTYGTILNTRQGLNFRRAFPPL